MRFFLIYILLFPLLSNAGEISKEELRKVFIEIRESYKKEQAYAMDITHKSFLDHSNTTPYESSKGSFVKDGNNYRSEVMKITSIQNQDFKIAISDEYKIIVMSQKDDYLNIALDKDELDVMLSQSVKIESSKIGTQTLYRVAMAKEHELEYFTLKVNEDKFITEMGMYYRKEQSWMDDDGKELKGKPKLVITYSNIKKGITVEKKSFSFDEIIRNTPEGYKPIGKYSEYTLNDNRIKIK